MFQYLYLFLAHRLLYQKVLCVKAQCHVGKYTYLAKDLVFFD